MPASFFLGGQLGLYERAMLANLLPFGRVAAYYKIASMARSCKLFFTIQVAVQFLVKMP
jgi:hypothetical protein